MPAYYFLRPIIIFISLPPGGFLIDVAACYDFSLACRLRYFL
jgi:hypothetical protein